MPNQPWEDESLKGAYYAEKKRQADVKKSFKAATPPPAKIKTPMDDAFGAAAKAEKRNKTIASKVGGWSKK